MNPRHPHPHPTPEGHVSVAAGLGHRQDEATLLGAVAHRQGRQRGIDLAARSAARAGQIHQGLRQTKGLPGTSKRAKSRRNQEATNSGLILVRKMVVFFVCFVCVEELVVLKYESLLSTMNHFFGP